MTVGASDTPTLDDLGKSLEAIQAGPPAFVVLEVEEGHERRAAISILRRLPLTRPVKEFTFSPGALDIRTFLTASPEQDSEVVFLFGLAGLGSPDRQRAWASLNVARESIRASRRSFVLFLSPVYADEFPLHAPDLRACVTVHFRLDLLGQAHAVKELLAEKLLPEAQHLLRQAVYYESRITEPVVVPESRAALLRDYADLLEIMGESARAEALRADARRLAKAPADESPWLLHAYLEGLLKETSVIRLSDLAVKVGQQILEIAFDDIWVPVRLLRVPVRQPVEPRELDHPHVGGEATHTTIEEEREEARFPFQPLGARGGSRPEPITIEDVLRLGSVVVLGDPGTGKSTFLRWIARITAKALLDQLDPNVSLGVVDLLRDRAPILVHARRLADRLSATEEDPAKTLATVGGHSSGMSRILEGRLRAGRCLVLVDGLDVIPSSEAREKTRRFVERLVRDLPGNAIIVTSRIVGYDLVRLGSPFEHVSLAELDEGGIREFTRQWYRTISRASPAPADESPERRAEILFEAIVNNPGIRRIAGNPLLLTITALIHWRGGRLPARRVAVYEAATRTLLDNWLARRAWVRLNAEEMISVLSKIAFDMHEAGETGLIPASRLGQLFCDKLAEARFVSSEAVRGEVDHLLATLSLHSGLFLERGIGDKGEPLYGFLHLTFQEYLAGLYLFQRWTGWILSPDGPWSACAKASGNPVYSYFFQPRWQEVVLLAAGRASETNDALATTFVGGVISYSDKYESILRRALLFGARILADDVRVDKITAEKVCSALVELLIEGDILSQRRAALGIFSRFAGTIYAGLVGNELLVRLASGRVRAQSAAAEALGALKDPRAVEPLLQWLEDGNSSVRRAAAEALGALKDPRALDRLLERLGDAEDSVRRAVAEALGALKDPRALEALLARLEDADFLVRWAAAEGIGELKDSRALDPLLKRLEHEKPSVREAAGRALGVLKDPRALEPLLKRLVDASWALREAAAWALGQLEDHRAVEMLIRRLEDEHWSVRQAAARALGVLRDPKALEALIDRLGDSDLDVRAAAAWALGALKDTRTVEPLLKRLGEGNSEVRAAAAWALGGLKDPRAVEALILRLEDEHWAVRWAAAKALGQLKDSRVLEPLLKRLGDRDSGLRREVAEALGALKDPHVVDEVAIIALRTPKVIELGGMKYKLRGEENRGIEAAQEALFRLLYGEVI